MYILFNILLGATLSEFESSGEYCVISIFNDIMTPRMVQITKALLIVGLNVDNFHPMWLFSERENLGAQKKTSTNDLDDLGGKQGNDA